MRWIKITKDTVPTKADWYITRRQYIHDNSNDWGDILQINFDPKYDDSNRFLQHYPKGADVFYLDESGSEPEGKEAVEFADFINKNVYVRYTINRGWHKLGKNGSYTTEQLYKIWKEQK